MGIGRRVGAFLGLVPEDQLAEHDEFGPDAHDDYDDRPSARTGHPMGYGEFDGPDYRRAARSLDEHPDRMARAPRFAEAGGSREPVVHGALAVKPEPAPRRDPMDVTASRPAAVKLTGFAEARVIGEKYREGQSVILDMTDMSDSDARRLVDFSAGLAFSLHGSIEKVAPKVFMLLPPDTDVASPAAENLLRDARAYAGR